MFPVVRKILPRASRDFLSLMRAYLYDARRFFRYSAMTDSHSPQQALRATITRKYHSLEKGLAFPHPEPGHGKAVARALIHDIDQYEKRWSGDDHVIHIAKTALVEYERFNSHGGVELDWLAKWLAEHKVSPRDCAPPSECEESCCNDPLGGVVDLEQPCSPIDAELFGRFVRARHSIRNFSDKPVTRHALERAVAAAQYAPSVCNRQAPRVFIYQDRDKICDLLELQNGNRGFIECINTLLVVTAQTDHFYSTTERNQCWIDGGLFAMSLLLALHAEGLGACCLNWCTPTGNDIQAHRRGDIPERDAIIMMMAVGHPNENVKVAKSTRKPLDEVAIFKS